MITALSFIRQHGRLPDDLVSKEDQNSVGESGISDDEVEDIRQAVRRRCEESGLGERAIVLVDGFLLFGRSVPELREAFDLRVMLRANYDSAKARREARAGYVTLEGFWEDPPGYVDFIVWPAYKLEHGFLFRNQDVEAEVDESVVTTLGIEVCPGKGSYTVKESLHWVIELVLKHLSTIK